MFFVSPRPIQWQTSAELPGSPWAGAIATIVSTTPGEKRLAFLVKGQALIELSGVGVAFTNYLERPSHEGLRGLELYRLGCLVEPRAVTVGIPELMLVLIRIGFTTRTLKGLEFSDPKYSVANTVGFLKGKSAIRIHREYLGRQRAHLGSHRRPYPNSILRAPTGGAVRTSRTRSDPRECEVIV